MEILKNTFFINTIWIILAVLFIVIGFYREELFKADNKDLQNKIISLNQQTIDLSQVILQKQKLFELTLSKAVKSGQINQDTARKLRNIYNESISLNATTDIKADAEVIKKPLDSHSSLNVGADIKTDAEVIRKPAEKPFSQKK
jgi:hypothetical protein